MLQQSNSDGKKSTKENKLKKTNESGSHRSPFSPVHPGKILRVYTMPERNWDVKTLATKLNVATKNLDAVINERAPVNDDLSERLGNLLGISKSFWRNFQRGYDLEVIDGAIKRKMSEAGVAFSAQELKQQRLILMAFSFTKSGAEIGSVHAQKIMFLIDNQIDNELGVPCFEHVPYKHGPNDHRINGILNNLIDEKFMRITISNNHWSKRKYILNENGRSIGQKLVSIYPEHIGQQMKDIVEWAMGLNWKSLKDEIYKIYNDLKPDDD